jgi:elongator complex protein 6
VFVNADLSFASRIRARLEIEEASFLTTLAHQASCLSTFRMLDTGLAKGISGVIRVTISRDSSARTGYDWNEREVLYHVRDGSVEVFDRGDLGN